MTSRLLALPLRSRRRAVQPGPGPRHRLANRSARQGRVPVQLRSEGAARVRARRRDAALVLVLGRREGVPRRAQGRPAVRDRDLGHRVDPDVESARRAGRLAEGRRGGAGRDRRRPPHRREDRARARLHRGGRGLLRRLRDPLRARAAGWPARRRTKRWPQRYPDDDEAQIFCGALHRRHADAGRPDLRGLPEGGRGPRGAVREVSRPSRASRTT